ncbi:NAD(P)H-binding protein [Actinomadura rayongensis]|uniref:NAD(P)H-binding protein n=1 Tax=Actinomadura rayongensis TaxID=1429076 RepID=A0A6I4WG04_9ACTN|nr:NAD(P)H-binding protein [Actinomadura rayongensis]MXQ66776.1 NAD(P)H-binding protein [Actinomadura rayongensis]
MIVITGPTGNIGHRVLAHVLTGDEPVRVVVRDPTRLPASVRDRVEVVQGSHGDPSVARRALDGADTVFWLVAADRRALNPDEAFVGFTRPTAAALRDHGVRRVVTISALGRGTPVADRAGHVTGSLAMDDLLAGTGVALRVLACGSFMDNMLRQAASIKDRGVFFDILPPDFEQRLVAARDIAAVASRLLLDPSWTGQEEIPLLGPEDLSYDEMAAIASDVLSAEVRYQQITPAALLSQLTDMSDGMAQAMHDMMTAKMNGLDNGVARTPQSAIDTPTTFREWCEQTLKPA